MGQLEKFVQQYPVFSNWLLFAAARHRDLHWYYPHESLNRGWGRGIDDTFLISDAERRRVPPYVIDALTATLGAWAFFAWGDRATRSHVWDALSVGGALLAFRVIAFLLSTFLHALCHQAPQVNPAFAPFRAFPGTLLRISYTLDVVIPQSLFIGLLFGWRIGCMTFVASFTQFVYRVFVQQHRVYMSHRWRPLDVVVLLAGLALAALWYWNR